LPVIENQRKKREKKEVDLENVIEAAIDNGLSADKAGIDNNPVYTD
jgi:hypothetical protein